MPRKLRILALHGYTSNAFILQRRIGAIRKACRDVADFVVVNGPLRVEPITAPVESLDAPSSSSSGGYTAANDPNMPLEEQPRAWWRSSDDGTEYRHFDATVDFLCAEVAQHGPFDGVFGFSQGACMAAIVASAFEDPTRYQRFCDKLPAGQGPLRFCISVSGFAARDDKLKGLFAAHGIQTPILHVLGRADQIVDDGRAQTLVRAAARSRVEHHDSGHVIPSQCVFPVKGEKARRECCMSDPLGSQPPPRFSATIRRAPWRTFLRDFLATFQDNDDQSASGKTPSYTPNDEWAFIDGPASRPRGEQPSEPNSGTATPAAQSHNDNANGNDGNSSAADKRSSL